MEYAIKLLTEAIRICESNIIYNSKFLEIEKLYYPERYKNTIIKIQRETNKKCW